MTQSTPKTLILAALRATLIALPLAVSLSACATMSPAEQAAMTIEAERPITCSGGADCELKWGRSLQWVLNNCTYKIQTQSEAMISTMGPLPDDPSPAFTITKTSDGHGGYVIDFRGGCDNMFGCQPSLLDSKASFARAVLRD